LRHLYKNGCHRALSSTSNVRYKSPDRGQGSRWQTPPTEQEGHQDWNERPTKQAGTGLERSLEGDQPNNNIVLSQCVERGYFLAVVLKANSLARRIKLGSQESKALPCGSPFVKSPPQDCRREQGYEGPREGEGAIVIPENENQQCEDERIWQEEPEQAHLRTGDAIKRRGGQYRTMHEST
jgi:hypothetical protein